MLRRDRAQRWVVGLTAAVAVGAVSATAGIAAAVAATPSATASSASQNGASRAGNAPVASQALRPPKQSLAGAPQTGTQQAPAATTTGS
ncbi:MAG: hypothetical protein WAN48_05705 [Actinomycetes bacterium]